MLRLSDHDVDAISVGGLETCIQLPAWNLAFDFGRCPPGLVHQDRILCTHAHLDHLGGIATYAATRDLIGLGPPTVWVPAENHADVLALFDVWRRLDKSDLPVDVRPCAPGDRIPLGPNRHALVFRAPHRVRAHGYALVSTRKRLSAAYAGRSQGEIRDARLAGAEVSESVETVEVAFTGDSRIEVVEREAAVRTARLLIMEVTFLDDRVSVEKSRSSGHIHLDEVIERAHLFENASILFTHFSARYSAADIVRILADRLPPLLRDRVTPLLPG